MRARGQQRREALVDAAAGLLGREGPAALSARAVAGEAGVPLAAVTYYFDTVDDLVRAAAERLYDGYLLTARTLVEEHLRLTPSADERDCAALVVRMWLDPGLDGPDVARVRSLLTSLAAAAANPALAPRLRRYDEALQDLVRRVLADHGRDVRRTRVLLASLDGFALARLCGVAVSPAPAARPGGADLAPGSLLAGLTDDLLLVWDDLVPSIGQAPPVPAAQNNRAVGSSRPDSAT